MHNHHKCCGHGHADSLDVEARFVDDEAGREAYERHVYAAHAHAASLFAMVLGGLLLHGIVHKMIRGRR